MKSIKYQKILIISLLFFFLQNCSSQPMFSKWEIHFYDEEEFTFDPEKVVRAINNDDYDQLSFEKLSPLNNEEFPLKNNILWNQDDYLKVSQAFYNQYTDYNLGDWILYEIRFDTWCEKSQDQTNNELFQYPWGFATIDFYKEAMNFDNDVPYRYVNNLYLDLNSGYLIISKEIHTPLPREKGIKLPKWGQLNLLELKIKAEDALRIVQNEIGGNFSSCSITISNSTADEFDGWKINYLASGKNYQYVINDQTGKIEVIK